MPSTVKFIVEGKADKKLLMDIAHKLGVELSNNNFVSTGGYCSNWIELNHPHILRAKADSMRPVLILDANGNFANRKQSIDSQLTSHNLADISYFILPNNASNGNLENLLINCINPNHASILTCFDNYCNCLAAYNPPDLKSKVYSYADALLPIAEKKKAKEENRDYNDVNIWNLDAPQLGPLKAFLQTHL